MKSTWLISSLSTNYFSTESSVFMLYFLASKFIIHFLKLFFVCNAQSCDFIPFALDIIIISWVLGINEVHWWDRKSFLVKKLKLKHTWEKCPCCWLKRSAKVLAIKLKSQEKSWNFYVLEICFSIPWIVVFADLFEVRKIMSRGLFHFC